MAGVVVREYLASILVLVVPPLLVLIGDSVYAISVRVRMMQVENYLNPHPTRWGSIGGDM